MELTIPQKEGLTELINIGYGRAAGALSELTGYRVTLEVPRIAMHAMDEIGPLLAELVQGDVASVNQVFTGPVTGNALLVLDEEAAVALSHLLSDNPAQSRRFDANDREIITEVGNILLNACLGVFANILQIQVKFTVPRLQVSGVNNILDSLPAGSGDLQYGLMVQTRFQLRTSNVNGFMFIVLGISSFDRMLGELENWEQRQTS